MSRRLHFRDSGIAILVAFSSISSWIFTVRYLEFGKSGSNIVDKDATVYGSSLETRVDAAIALGTDVDTAGFSLVQKTRRMMMGLRGDHQSSMDHASWLNELIAPHAAQSILHKSIIISSHDSALMQTVSISPQSTSAMAMESRTVPQSQSRPLREEFEFRLWINLLCVPALCVPALFWASTSEEAGPWVVIACYMFASKAMIILNEEAALNFKAKFLLVLIQMAVADVAVLCMQGRKVCDGQWRDLRKWSVVPFFFAGMLVTSMWALKEATPFAALIPRSLLPIISFGAEKLLFNTPPGVTSSMIISLLVTFAGMVLYGYADASVTTFGKVLIGINCWFTLLDRLVQVYFLKFSKDFSLSVPMCMLLNNSLGAIPVMGLAIGTGEISEWSSIVSGASSLTWFWVVISSGCGVCLGYAGLRAQKLVSGTLMLNLQNSNKIVLLAESLVISWICLRDRLQVFLRDRLQTVAWLGCAISLIGCLWYNFLRLPVETEQQADGGDAEEFLASGLSRIPPKYY